MSIDTELPALLKTLCPRTFTDFAPVTTTRPFAWSRSSRRLLPDGCCVRIRRARHIGQKTAGTNRLAGQDVTGTTNNMATTASPSRDDRDTGRGTAPLCQAADAALLDTSFLSIDAAVQRAIALVEARTAAKALTA